MVTMLVLNRQSAIGNDSNGWPTPAAPLKFGKATPTWNHGVLIIRAGTKSTGCCWPRFQIIPSLVESPFHPFPNRHFDPIGTEFL
jgi:hypothetical protein